jgi:hypothetical protein
MKKITLIISVAALAAVMVSCSGKNCCQERKAVNESARQEKAMINDAIRNHSNDVMQVELIGNSVVYTEIYDGIIDMKTYTYDGDTCTEVERVYVYPDQKSALRHYRRAIELAQFYDNIEIFNNQVKYDLKDVQRKFETDGLTKEQLKAKFDKEIAALKKHHK